MLMKPAMMTFSRLASVAPASITSASSRRIVSNASPMAWVPVAQADEIAMFGPVIPRWIAITPDAVSGRKYGRNIGATRSGPREASTRSCSMTRTTPPAAVPTTAPTRSASSSENSSPASATASRAATSANWTPRSIWRRSFGLAAPTAENSLTSAACWTSMSDGIEEGHRGDPVPTVDEAVPGLGDGVPERCDSPEAGDDDPPTHAYALLSVRGSGDR